MVPLDRVRARAVLGCDPAKLGEFLKRRLASESAPAAGLYPAEGHRWLVVDGGSLMWQIPVSSRRATSIAVSTSRLNTDKSRNAGLALHQQVGRTLQRPARRSAGDVADQPGNARSAASTAARAFARAATAAGLPPSARLLAPVPGSSSAPISCSVIGGPPVGIVAPRCSACILPDQGRLVAPAAAAQDFWEIAEYSGHHRG